MQAATVKVGKKPIQIVGLGAPVKQSNSVRIRNTSSSTLFIGGEDVTAHSGYPIDAGDTFELGGVSAQEPVFGVSDGSDVTVAVLAF